MELLLSCLSLIAGYRTEADYQHLYEHATAHYCFNPDEINVAIFNSHPDSKFYNYKTQNKTY